MMHRLQLQLGALEGPEAAFDDTQALVCTGSIFRREGVIIGLDNPLAITPGSLLDGIPVQTNVSFVSDSEITLGPGEASKSIAHWAVADMFLCLASFCSSCWTTCLRRLSCRFASLGL